MNEREWAELARQIAGVTIQHDDDGDRYVTIPKLSPYWGGAVNIVERDGEWAVDLCLNDKREPLIGSPYTEAETRQMLIDLTRAYEVASMLNKIAPKLKGATA